jgi:rhodanese-related sulfurtransferase
MRIVSLFSLACILTVSVLLVPSAAQQTDASSAADPHGQRAAGARESTPQEVVAALKDEERLVLLIDVREPAEYAAGHAEDAINIPIGRLEQRIRELQVPKTTEIVVMCAHGNRSSRGAVQLEKMGYKAVTFCPLEKWEAAGLKTQRAPAAAAQPAKRTGQAAPGARQGRASGTRPSRAPEP